MLLAATTATAQTAVTSITSPVPGWGPIDRWAGTEVVRGSQAIDLTYDRGTNPGSVRFSGDAGTAGGLRNRVALLSGPNGFGLLKDLEGVGFDWYRNSSSTTGAIQSPALRLFVRSGSPTAYNYSELIWEWTYNGGANPAPTNGWQSVSNNLTTGTWWRWNSGVASCSGASYTTLGAWSGCLGTDALVYGISLGLGGLPDQGSFDGAVDLPRLKFAGQEELAWDFGTGTVVPEPSTYALMAAGLAGLFAVQRRRRVRA